MIQTLQITMVREGKTKSCNKWELDSLSAQECRKASESIHSASAAVAARTIAQTLKAICREDGERHYDLPDDAVVVN